MADPETPTPETPTPETPTPLAPAPYDLTTLEAVKLQIRRTTNNAALDDQIQQAITGASKAILHWSGREFGPVVEETRTLRWDGRQYVNFQPWDLQAGTVSLDGEALVEGTHYRFLPVEHFQGVYTYVELAMVYRSGPWSTLEIEGTWGFPEIPADVAQATIITVLSWTKRDVSSMALENQGEAGQGLPEAMASYDLPLAARRLLGPYKRSTGGLH